MKSRLLLLSLLSMSSLHAAELKWNIEGRFDYINAKLKHEYASDAAAGRANFTEKRGQFESGALRLNATYDANEFVSGRFRYRLSTGQETTRQNRDLSFRNVDLFFVDFKTDIVKVRVGKHFFGEIAGRETIASITDLPVTLAAVTANPPYGATKTQYFYSLLSSGVQSAMNADADLFHVGAGFIYDKIPNHTITLDFFNPGKGDYADAAATGATANNASNTGLGYGLYYNGSLFDKMFQPVLGYTVLNIDGDNVDSTVDAKNTLMIAGFMSEFAGVALEFDYKVYDRENSVFGATAANNSANETKSIWTRVAYTMNKWTPYVNYIKDDFKQDKTTSVTSGPYKRDALAVGVVFKPYDDKNIKFSLGYTNDVKKITLAANSTAENKIKANVMALGLKFDL